jgi:hypothetical protein
MVEAVKVTDRLKKSLRPLTRKEVMASIMRERITTAVKTALAIADIQRRISDGR